MGNKILIISPTPTHPANAGNRTRIFNIASFLISKGHAVHFLFSRQESADESAMRNFWGENFYAVDYKKPGLTKIEYIRRGFMRLILSDYKYYSTVDEHYNLLLDEKIREVSAHVSFDMVLVEYIFLSKAFLNFGHAVLKVIDTHDVMTDRHKLFLREGKKPVWYSVPYSQEKKGIRRADVVIAIQEKEKAHFKRMTRKQVVNVGHIVQVRKSISEEPRRNILFVGSNNPSNLYGINDFLNVEFPRIRETFPDLELLIAGNICGELKQLPDGVTLLGEVDDLSEAYNRADIVINPLTIGTGLKIKMIEALGHSKVVLSTPVGADGLEEGAGSSYLLYHNSSELLDQLKMVYSSNYKYKDLCLKAAEFTEKWNQKNGNELLILFSGL
jgi:glycosyltransferase involved in cell wall biosynthesis